MSKVEQIWVDIVTFTEASKTFIGEFLYEPFRIESSYLLNSVTLYAVLGLVAFVAYRAIKPAHRARYRRPYNDYDYGRNV